MKILARTISFALAAVLAGSLAGGAAQAEDKLRAVTAFPKALIYVKSFLKFVDKVNAEGKGVVQIEYIGGPEAIPRREQADAVRNGVVDMQYGPASYYPGVVPESDALVGANTSPMEQRANGGLALMNQIHQKKLNAFYLAHPDSGAQFHIYLTKEPKRNADGGLDLTGFKLRSAPIYREFFVGLGAVHVGIPVPEVYTSLERGLVDGLGWPSTGVMDFSWDKHLKYRVDPGFFEIDLGILVNLDKWKSLSQASRDLLQKIGIQHEKESYQFFKDLEAKEDAEVQKRGLKIIKLEGAAAKKYLDAAYKVPWERLKGRDATHYNDLRAKFFKE
jgi:TRAP-type C4-dicarboxylate transport system substrate-binding protein